jgi:large subunit ribosomal protein L28
MARICMMSGKKTSSGNNRSHSMRATKRRYKVNLIKKKIVIDGFPITVKIAANYYKKYKNMFVN